MHEFQRHMVRHQDDLACVLEIHSDPTGDVRLHLPQSPIGLVRVPHHHSGFQHVVQASHVRGSCVQGDVMTDQTDLAALLAARICHDLISPLGAIGNGVELLMLDGAGDRPEIALIAESVASANARIRFLRVAFGIAGAEQRLGQPEIAGLLADWTHGGRLRVDWQAAGDHARPDVQRAFLALMCLEAALPLGGLIVVTRPGAQWVLSASGRRIRSEGIPWVLLTDAEVAVDLTAPQVQFGLLRAGLLRGPGLAGLTLAEDGIELVMG